MSYRIDGETPYWGGLSIPCKEREYPDAWDWIFKEMTRTLEESRNACKEWDEMANKLREKLEQMEKKKNKMTKAEAFEWLKNKKIRCIDGSGNHFLIIMSILENVGFRWCGTNQHEDYQVFCLFTSNNGRVTYLDIANAHEFNDELEEEVLMEDILSLEIEEECAKDGDGDYAANKISLLGSQICEILRQMNGHYHVEITEDDVNLYAEGVNLYHSDPF